MVDVCVGADDLGDLEGEHSHSPSDPIRFIAGIDDDAVTLIDVMPEPHFRGEMAMYARPGHITSAINISVMGLTGEDGRFRAEDELAAMHTTDHGARHITYCGGGIAASADAFVLTRLGFKDVAIYAASLEEWTANPDNPMDVELDD